MTLPESFILSLQFVISIFLIKRQALLKRINNIFHERNVTPSFLCKLQTLFKFPSENQFISHMSISSSASAKLPYDFVSGLRLIVFASSIASNTSGLYWGYFTWNGKPPCNTTCLRKILTALLFCYRHPCEYLSLHLPYCHRL